MHYKIKDDVDNLSVLERYGYSRAMGCNAYVKVNDEAVISILFNREIMFYYFPQRMCYLEEQNKHYIKDLIDAELVEEANND